MSKNDSTVPALDFKGAENIQSLAAAIKKDFQIGEGGTVTVDKDFYQKHLPEGLTPAAVKQVQDFNSDLVAATGLALGEVGIDLFKKSKGVDALALSFAAGKDKVEFSFDRSRQFPDGKGGQLNRNGVLSARWSVAGASNKGSFKKVREHLAERAAAVLAK